jgi:hypothetical protein
MRRLPPSQPAIFDAAWYLGQTSDADARRAPWRHYWETGWRQGLSPLPLFDAPRYLRLYPDIAAAGQEPLSHYLTVGWREQRSPHALFDFAWYARQRVTALDPLTDYLTQGWLAGCSPHPLFHVAHYRSLRGRPAMADAVDYVVAGAKVGLEPHPWFSTRYYSTQAALAAEVEPLTHYIEQGCRSDAAPHPDFDPRHYRARYLLRHADPPNPLIDFVTFGWVLERSPRADPPAAWRTRAQILLGPQPGNSASSPTA